MKKRLLITGATGMLGSTLAKRFQQSFDVFATGSVNPGFDFINNFMEFDLANSDYSKLIEWSQPEIIIHAAALTNGNYCEQHPKEAFDINGISLQKICQSTSKNTHIIYVSTDAVFPNNQHLAKEIDCVHPESVYGKSKEIGEFFLKHSNSDYTIVRTTIVGTNFNKQRQGFVEWIVNSSKNNQEISLFEDVIFTPISIWNLTDHLGYIIENSKLFSGVTLHVAGNEICSKYEFGTVLLKALNLPIGMIKKGRISDFSGRAKRSTDQTLDSQKFEKMSFRGLPNLKQTIEEIKNDYNEKH
ncbi:MAG: SDR family oxidoreductase [Aquaticitalea sp.]